MKNILPLLFLALFSCGQDQATLDRIAKLSDKVATLESAQAVNYSRLDQLEQEQTFQYKDIDSTKRALGAVYMVALEAHGVAVRVDSTVKVGRDRVGKRTAFVMEAASWVPWLAPFIKRPK